MGQRPFKGPKKRLKVDKDRLNAGGFYEGMPGCVLNEHGHRKMLEFIVTPEGENTALIHAHPRLAKVNIQQAMTNPMVKGMMYGAVVDDMFSKKNPLNWPIRIRYQILRWWHYQQAKRKANKQAKQNGTTQNHKEA